MRDREQRRRDCWGTCLVAHHKSGEAPMPSPLLLLTFLLASFDDEESLANGMGFGTHRPADYSLQRPATSSTFRRMIKSPLDSCYPDS